MSKFLELAKEFLKEKNIDFEVIDKTGHLLKFKDKIISSKSPYPNNSINSAIARDKAFTYQLLEKSGFKIPKSEYIYNSNFLFNNFPCFVKPNSYSNGFLVSKVENKTELKKAINSIKKIEDIVIIQEYVKGEEYRFFIMDGKLEFSYRKESLKPCKNLCGDVKIQEYTEIFSDEIKNWAKKLSEVTGLFILGVDVITNSLNHYEFIILEVNSNPSLKGICSIGQISKAKEIVKKVINKIIET